MDIKLIRNSEDAVFSSISNGLILQLTDDNYKFLDFTGKKMYILNSTTKSMRFHRRLRSMTLLI